MFFAHGTNKAYNYILMRHMFVNQTEGRSIADGRIKIKKTRKDADNDVDFPVFTRDLPPSLTRSVQHIWQLYRVFVPDEPIKFFITVYATYAYSFLNSTSNTLVGAENIINDIHDNRSLSSINRFLYYFALGGTVTNEETRPNLYGRVANSGETFDHPAGYSRVT